MTNSRCGSAAEEPMVCRLSAGAEWIRTFSSAPDGQQFVVSSELGPMDRRTVIQAVAGFGEPIELSGGVRVTATHRPDQAASHQGRAVGGASASRNRRFGSVPLHPRVERTSNTALRVHHRRGACRWSGRGANSSFGRRDWRSGVSHGGRIASSSSPTLVQIDRNNWFPRDGVIGGQCGSSLSKRQMAAADRFFIGAEGGRANRATGERCYIAGEDAGSRRS